MATSADFDRGRRIGKYEILTRLSTGGMAELFLGYLPGPGGFKKFVAVKQILPDVRADQAFVRMFLDEARITAAFNHPNIGQVFDLGHDPTSRELYLAMEFIAGQNLEQLVKRAGRTGTAIPVGFAARVIRDACLGLHYAHTFKDPTGQPMAVVHRDVSPKNVMITYTGQVKMIDFGIAKARGRLNRTQVGVVKGTGGYMAPEQVRNHELDGRTDLFAAGVMLHELLTGQRLFTAPSDAAMMIKIAEEEAADPSALNPAVPAQLAQVCLKALSKDRAGRFATGRELARAIEQACPELFEDEQLAEVMAQLFADKIAVTRSLLEAATEGGDPSSMTEAVKGLSSQDEPAERPARRSGALHARPTATPDRARPGKATGARRASTGTSGVVKPAPRSRSSLERVEADPTPPRRPSRSLEPVAPTQEEQLPEPRSSGGGLGGLVAILVALLMVAGVAWAATMGPLKDQAQALFLEQTAEPPPPDLKPTPIDATAAPGSTKPRWLVEKEAQEAELAAERARQKAIEDAANDPERQALLKELQAQLTQLDALEEEQRELKVAAAQGQATGAANSKKIDDLQKQIDELKAAVQLKQRRAGPGDGAEVAVVRDERSARQAAVGYVTLRTLNPDSAAVLLEGTALGSTPLSRVPLEAGTHALRVVDEESRQRILSVTVKSGQTQELNVDVRSLPLAP